MNEFTQMQQEAVVSSGSSPTGIFAGREPNLLHCKGLMTQPLWETASKQSQIIQLSNYNFHQEFWGAHSKVPGHIQPTYIQALGPMDILAGRTGKRKENILGKGHAGSKIFAATIARYLQEYQDHTHRQHRSSLIKDVVGELLDRGCRFVKYDSKFDSFLILNEKQIRDKVSFAFRHQSLKQDSPRKSKRESTGSSMHSTKEGVQRTMENWSTTSPRSVRSTSSVIWDPQHACLRPCRSAQPATSCPKAHDKEKTRSGSKTKAISHNEEDDRDFIDMIEELDVDGLTMIENEAVNTVIDDIVSVRT